MLSAAAHRLARQRSSAAQLAEAAAAHLGRGSAASAACSGGGCSAAAAAAARQQWGGAWSLHPRHRVATAAGSTDVTAALAKARRMAGPLGLLAGVFGSIVGVGGGVIIVPAIVSSCKSIPQRVVAGTSLAAVVSTAIASAYTYGSQGCLDPGSALLIAPAALLTAPFGARLTSRLDCGALRRILGYFLLAAAPMVPLKAYLLSGDDASGADSSSSSSSAGDGSSSSGPSSSSSSSSGNTPPPPGSSLASALDGIRFPPPAQAAVLVATGAVAGVASGLLGVGGGLIVTPLLALTQPISQATVLGTSLLAMIFPASAALWQHQRLGNVDWRMAAALAAGTAVGSAAGSNLAVAAPPGWLEGAFTIGMLFLGRKTLQTARR